MNARYRWIAAGYLLALTGGVIAAYSVVRNASPSQLVGSSGMYGYYQVVAFCGAFGVLAVVPTRRLFSEIRGAFPRGWKRWTNAAPWVGVAVTSATLIYVSVVTSLPPGGGKPPLVVALLAITILTAASQPAWVILFLLSAWVETERSQRRKIFTGLALVLAVPIGMLAFELVQRGWVF